MRPARGFILLPVVLTLTLLAAVAFLLNREGAMNVSIAARGLQADSARYVAQAGLARINNQTQGANCSGYADFGATAFGPHSFTATVNPKGGTPVTLTATAATADGAAATLTRSNVTVYQTNPTSATLQSSAGTGADTYLSWTSPGNNYGLANSVLVQTAAASGLLQFNLASIPAGSKITGATLQLSKSNGTFFSGTIVVYRVTTPWIEGTKTGSPSTISATYNTAGATLWTTPGGDYDPAAVASLTNIMQGWNSWDVTSLVQGWSSGSFSNYGMILVPTTIDVYAEFVSKDDSGSMAPYYPKLLVTYYAPCGGTPPPTTLTAIKDAALWETNNNRNYGASTSVILTAQPDDSFIVTQFDLSGVAPGTPIQSAKLRFYTTSMSQRSGAAMLLSAYRITRTWVEGTKTGSGTADGATWNRYDATNNWTTSGGDYSTPAAGSVTLPASFASGWFEITITALAQAWIDGVTANNGIIVRTLVNDLFNINLREAASNKPELVITY